MSKELLARKAELEKQLAEIEAQLLRVERNLKPYEAIATGYSGRFSTFFKTEEQGRKKFEEYCGKKSFRNGLLYGVILQRHNDDGSISVLDVHKKVDYWNPPVINDEE